MKDSILVIYEDIVAIIGGRVLKLSVFEDIAIRKRTEHVAASFYIMFYW